MKFPGSGNTSSTLVFGGGVFHAGKGGDLRGEHRHAAGAQERGDAAAREKLIAGNLRLVLSVVQKFAGRGESMDDLFQVGVIGLIKAVDAFDLSQGVQFSTYGVPAIIGWRKATGG